MKSIIDLIVALDELPRLAFDKKDDDKVRTIMQKLYESGKLTVKRIKQKAEILEFLEKAIPHPVRIVAGTDKTVNNHPRYEDYLIDPYVHGGEDLSGVLFNRYLKDGERNTLFMNYGEEPETIEVAVEAKDVPEVWETFTGEISAAEIIRKTEMGYVVKLDLPCNHGILLVSE